MDQQTGAQRPPHDTAAERTAGGDPVTPPGGANVLPTRDAQRAVLRDRLHFLNDATRLIGTTLDMEHTVRELAAVLVPELADVVTVHLIEALLDQHQLERDIPIGAPAPDVLLRRVAVLHTEDEGSWLGIAPEGGVHSPRETSPLRRVMTEAKPVLIPRIDSETAQVLRTHLDTDPATAALLDERSLLAVPLYVRGRILGAAILLRGGDRPAFDEVDTLIVRQLAAQAGLGVDNAHLYRTEATVADALQRSMLPTLPRRLGSVELADRYLSASQTKVGGDWFDAIRLPGGRVALVVGDVMGHGLRSAAVMGQFRTAVSTLAALDLPPEQVLRHLDDLAQQLGANHLATCIYAVYDPVSRRCTIANAGHIPPLLLRRDGRAEILEPPTGAPIGVGGVAFESADIAVADGDVLVLCTDGLVEVRGEELGKGLSALRDALSGPNRSLDVICDDLLATLDGREREDDIALLSARMRGVPQGNVASWFLQPRETTPARVRRIVRSTLEAWDLSEVSDITELLATELVTNAVRHATKPIQFRMLRTDALLCEVTDDDHRRPVLRHAADTDEGGRGLQLVSRLAERWGSSGTPSGKVVWFEQHLPSSDPLL
ncbi:GAF domain-containing protein [Murinocardiopsis flavida]|uniref:protein-serine/threonine phosphatase n=1 Tax=Murinocardiopsis flavida TaxID=645275 RepID=A0A2P8DUL6_9ACTN|nr:SpoIIE family protein phosphatase [Murinocardiopsis flavida]PSL00917.1 GAF domain-containing protein [Murinocardiopsis flavida]